MPFHKSKPLGVRSASGHPKLPGRNTYSLTWCCQCIFEHVFCSKLPNTKFLGSLPWRNHLRPAAWTWVMGHVHPMGILKHNGHMDCHYWPWPWEHADHVPPWPKMCQAELVLFPNNLSTSPFVIVVQLHLMMRQSQWLAIPWLPLWGWPWIKIHDSQLRLIGHLRIDSVQGFWLIAISVPFALKCGLVPRFLVKPL